jgi:DNA-binding transcriptional ArsR family regulator
MARAIESEGADAVFKALSDATRRKIIGLVLEGGMQVNDLVTECDMPQPTISKHLKILKDAGLLQCDKEGVRRIYRLAPFSRETKAIFTWLDMIETHE